MGLKEQLLQRKVETLRETLEMREALLYAALSTASLDPSAASEAATKLQVPFQLARPFNQHTPTHWAFPLLGPAGVQRSRRGGPAEGAQRSL